MFLGFGSVFLMLGLGVTYSFIHILTVLNQYTYKSNTWPVQTHKNKWVQVDLIKTTWQCDSYLDNVISMDYIHV